MSKFLKTLKDSIITLKKSPKLFLPKIFIAFLYTLPILGVSTLAIETLMLPEPRFELIGWALFWLFYMFIVMILDVLANAMYPFMVNDFYSNKPISFRSAFKDSLKKFFVVIPAVLLIEAVTMLIVFLIAIPLSLSLLLRNFLLAGFFFLLFIVILFILFAMFFLLYPVATLEKKNFLTSIIRSISLAKQNVADISKATAIVFFISFITFALAFLIDLFSGPEFLFHQIVFWTIFISARLIVALLSTYQYVLNPVFYLEYVKGAKL